MGLSMSRFIIPLLALSGLFMLSRDTRPLGIRNNNPGNIENNGTKWQGMADIQSGRFLRFVSPEYGFRAMARIIRTYSTRYGLNTVSGIINRWAPPIENDTASYIEHVAGVMGVSPDQTIDVYDDDVLAELLAVITLHENGVSPYDHMLIVDGVRMA